MLSNMGTTEHVDGQAGVWENIHRLVRPGGVYVGQTPYHDGRSWWWHGDWYPTEGFFESFAELNGWTIERLYRGREVPHQNLYCRMTKGDETPFAMPDESLIKRNQIRPR
jgi:SAM-dependent methyltransferase